MSLEETLSYPNNSAELNDTIKKLVDRVNLQKSYAAKLEQEVQHIRGEKDAAMAAATEAKTQAQVLKAQAENALKASYKSVNVPLFSGEENEDVDNFIFLLENSQTR